MTGQYLGAGTLSQTEGNTTPSLPAVTFAAGDELVMFDATFCSSANNAVTTPAGWSVKSVYTYAGTNGNIRMTWFYRPWVSGMAAPTVVWAGSNSVEHISRIFALRGTKVDGDPFYGFTAANSFPTSTSAAGPINPLGAVPPGSVVFVAALRDNDLTDDAAGFGVLTGDGVSWSEVLDFGSISGAELAAAVDVAVVPAGGATITSKTFTISGNSNSAVGMGQMLAVQSSTLTISPTGIPSAEVFGTPTVAGGLVTINVDGGGIPSAEAFGTPIVAIAQSVTGVGGIPSGEVMGGPHTVTPGTAVLRPTGIPTGEAFGRPTVVPGTAVIDLDTRGIPSAEAFGNAVLTYGIAETDLPRAYPRAEIPYPAISYELVCVARVPQTSGPPLLLETDPIDWTGLSYTDELSKPGSLSAGVNIASLTEPVLQRLRSLHNLPTELWLYRQGALIFAGPLLGYQVQNEGLSLQAQGLQAYMYWWYVMNDLTYISVDQAMIAKGLIDHWQSMDYGNFGLNTSNITPTGQVRDATYLAVEGHQIGKRVEEMGKREGGYDIDIDPQSRDVKLWYPTQGTDRSSGEDAIIFDQRNVTSGNIVCAASPSTIASEAIGIGTSNGPTVTSVASNLELRAKFGRTAVWQSFDGVSEKSTNDAYTIGLLNARAEALLVPGPEVRTTTDADLASYNVGDVVAYELHERLGVTGAYRIRKRTVTVSKIGREKTAVEFV